MLANYTWSHCISEATFGYGYQNPYNRNADRSSCAFDVRNIFNLSLVARASHIRGSGFVRAYGDDEIQISSADDIARALAAEPESVYHVLAHLRANDPLVQTAQEEEVAADKFFLA